jgi:hypothetical protein
MAVTNFSPLLGLALPTTGDLSGTWGTVVNDSITQLLDSAVAGTTTLSADTDVTLSTTNGAANQARNAIIRWTATGTVTRNITAPAQSKAYFVINATGGTQSIVIRGSGPTTGVTIPAGARALVAWNGSDFVKIVSNPVVLTSDVSGVLPIANGGTGTSSTQFVNAATNVTGVLPAANGGTGIASPGTAGNVLTSTGTAWVSSPSGGGGGGSVTSVSGSGSANGLSLSGTVTSTGNITLGGSVTSLTTANFTIEQSGAKLVFKYGATVIASMDSSGNIISAANVTGFGTP